MHVLNLGILAHVDAGKTTLTERLLYVAGVVDEPGSVDAGSTRTDSLELERRRGITIRSAVVSFEVDGVTVNLIDTPGHPDFIAEVERVLGVLDGVVLVISAVEGVQAQTRVLMRTLQQLGIPTVLFANKIDRRGARHDELVAEIRQRLTPAVVDLDGANSTELLDVLTQHDDDLLADYVAGKPIDDGRLATALAEQTHRARVHPLLFGSAITGAGVEALLGQLTTLLPVSRERPDGPVRGTVFKIERGPTGEKLAWVRMVEGTLHTRDRLPFGDGKEDRVTGIDLAEHGATHGVDALVGGRIGRLRGLAHARIGDPVGEGSQDEAPSFPPPVLETVVTPLVEADRGALHAALVQVTDQDPMLGLRRHELTGELSVALYGEVQKEVLETTLAEEYGVLVGFAPTTPVCIERVVGTGEHAERIDDDHNPFLAGVGLRVGPAPDGSGVTFRLGVERGSMPPAFFSAIEDGVRGLLAEGIHGWPVTDCIVTLTSSQYYPRQSHAHGTFDKSMCSTAADFRAMAPLMLMTALLRAGTVVHEPVHAFRAEVPVDTLGAVLAAAARLRGVPGASSVRGDVAHVEGEVPAVAVHALQQQLPGLTRGEGLLESSFSHHRAVAGGPVPERARRDDDPRHRRTYLLAVCPRVGRAPE